MRSTNTPFEFRLAFLLSGSHDHDFKASFFTKDIIFLPTKPWETLGIPQDALLITALNSEWNKSYQFCVEDFLQVLSGKEMWVLISMDDNNWLWSYGCCSCLTFHILQFNYFIICISLHYIQYIYIIFMKLDVLFVSCYTLCFIKLVKKLIIIKI